MILIRRIVKANNIIEKESRHSLFQFSNKIDYGLYLLVELAKNNDNKPLSLRVIAYTHHLSFFFLQKIALELRQAGIIEAVRGKNGGYILQKQPDRLSLKEILEALEGPIALMSCLNNTSCVRKDCCTMQRGLSVLNQLIINTFSKMTLSQLIHP